MSQVPGSSEAVEYRVRARLIEAMKDELQKLRSSKYRVYRGVMSLDNHDWRQHPRAACIYVTSFQLVRSGDDIGMTGDFEVHFAAQHPDADPSRGTPPEVSDEIMDALAIDAETWWIRLLAANFDTSDETSGRVILSVKSPPTCQELLSPDGDTVGLKVSFSVEY